ncbi:MAG: hypothetical protein ACREL1_00310 [bacterium]
MTLLADFQKPIPNKEVIDKVILYFDKRMRLEKFRPISATERQALIFGFLAGLEYEQVHPSLVKKIG